jgi:AraC family transcriptional regulator
LRIPAPFVLSSDGKEGDALDLLEKLTRAMDYVEANLEGEIDCAAVARLACCSSYNFQRMFAFIAGVTLAEYVRRRRMTLAGIALRQGAKVIDTALRFGYDSPVSFARAFREVHGINPSQARRGKVVLQAYPRISFQISIKGENPMKYRIEDKPAFTIFGTEGVFDPQDTYPNTPHGLWFQCETNGAYEKLARDAGSPPPELGITGTCRVHGACDYRDAGKDTCPYMQCAFVGPESKTEGWATAAIPAQTWAVFPSEPFHWDKVVSVINALYERFYREWLPGSGYEAIWGAGDLEIYGGDTMLGTVELWYPIRKKTE